MSRPNTPTLEKESFEELSKEIEDDYPNRSDCESRSSFALNNQSPNRGKVHDRDHNITVPHVQKSSTSMRSISAIQELMNELIGDINAMIESATSIIEAAHQIRNVVHQSIECVDLQSPAVSQLGLAGTIKDLRRETVRTVVDADRAHLRYRKVLAEFMQLRRCLRRLGVIPSPGSYGMSYHHHGGAGGSTSRDLPTGSAGMYRDLDGTG